VIPEQDDFQSAKTLILLHAAHDAERGEDGEFTPEAVAKLNALANQLEGMDEASLTEAERKDKLGRSMCYDDTTGVHIPCDVKQNDVQADVAQATGNYMPSVAAHKKASRAGKKKAAMRAKVLRSVGGSVLSSGKAALGAAKSLGKTVWNRIPAKGQKGLAALWSGIRWLEHQAMKGFEVGKRVAKQISVERGWSEATTNRVGWTIAVVDQVFAWTTTMPLAYMATGSKVGAKLSSFLPVASFAFLAGNFATAPLKTMRAAWKVIRGQDAGAKHVHESLREAMGMMDGAELAEELADRFEAFDEAAINWYLALYAAALDTTQDPREALEMADAAIVETPTEPEEGSVEFPWDA